MPFPPFPTIPEVKEEREREKGGWEVVTCGAGNGGAFRMRKLGI